MKHPITIVGGGLAGLALGIGLRRRGVHVTLHEAGSYPRHRVCGEFIRGALAATFARLGVTRELEDALRHRRTAWFRSDGRMLLESELPAPALGISRHTLDARLAERLVHLGGILHTKSRIPRNRPADGEIWTAGRRAESASPWIGLKLHATRFALESDLEMHLARGGYVGLAPVEEGKVNICGLFRIRHGIKASGSARLLHYLEESGLVHLKERLDAAEIDEHSFTGVSAFAFGKQPSGPGRCVLGDADRMVPPFTGNGMSVAFESAESALDPLLAYAMGECPWVDTCRWIRRRLDRRFHRRFAIARLVHPWLTSSRRQRISAPLLRSGLVPFRLLTRLLS